MKSSILVVALLAVVGVGCSQPPPPITINFVPITTPISPVTLSATTISIPQGLAVAVHAQPFQSGQQMDSSTTVSFSQDTAGVLGMDPSTLGDFPFVIYGVSQGTSTVNVVVNGSTVGQIQATVTAPVP
jgi:hypothetical protein